MLFFKQAGSGTFTTNKPALQADVASELEVRVLVLTEGEAIALNGKKRKFTKDVLEAIALSSNGLRSSGHLTRFVEDHEYSQANVLGEVVADFSVEELNETNLPHPGMTDLVGKFGLFTSLKIAGQENVTRYLDGRIKNVSAGIATDGDFPDSIFEISAVVWGAVRGASLYALTIAEQLEGNKIEAVMMKLDELHWAFRGVIRSITETDSKDLGDRSKEELISDAVEDLIQRIRTIFQQPLPTVTLSMTDTQNQDLLSQIEQYKAQLEQAEAKNRAIAEHTILLRKAQKLTQEGKLTPAALESLFGKEGDDSVELYSITASKQKNPVAFYLEMVEKYAVPVQLGATSQGQPIAEPSPSDLDQEVESFMTSYTLPKLY